MAYSQISMQKNMGRKQFIHSVNLYFFVKQIYCCLKKCFEWSIVITYTWKEVSHGVWHAKHLFAHQITQHSLTLRSEQSLCHSVIISKTRIFCFPSSKQKNQFSLSLWVVYNCFFAETGQAMMHWGNFNLHAVCKMRTWVTVGGFPEWGGVLC